MKRIALFILILSLTVSLSSCLGKGTPADSSLKNNEESPNVATSTAPHTFSSFEDFEKHEKSSGEKAVTFYYKPSDLTRDYELSQITKRDDVYVMFEYTVSSSKTVSAEKLSEYDAERLSTLICRLSLYADGEKALKANYIDKGYKSVEYEGKLYYRLDEYVGNSKENQIIGYEIAFLEDGNLIFMHLPAVDTFENMMKFAKLVKINIK